MKVTLINTTDAGGGAPAACMRLLKALVAKQVDAAMVVQEKKTTEPNVRNVTGKWTGRINFLRERLPFIFFYEKNKSVRFAFSPANAGNNISADSEIADADVLHLHWTNSGFQSINNLKNLFALNKPMVWTLHDMWAFTGGCHYSGGCNHFINQCGDCWMLRNPQPDDLSHAGWLRKTSLFAAKNITVVTCSNWLADMARKSSLLKGCNIITIPNPINTHIFAPGNKAAIRKKRGIGVDSKVILFGAANINDRRKGISYLVSALNKLKNDYNPGASIEVVIFGKNKHFDVSTLPFKVHELNIITSENELAEIYSLADVFISPAIEDNLPNMVMEAMSCATPVVAFNTGGIPDLVDHMKNGYLALHKSSEDLAKGLHQMLFSGDAVNMSIEARNKVLANFTNEIVAKRYIDLYQSITTNA
ncbi:glycosyltransferase family 4 protein [Mucilaginibacter hurinus]|nr:glycosyltransferase family 4 protein [Mucilaginibacter hurinus]